jgi:CheY-like chemotaxis protein
MYLENEGYDVIAVGNATEAREVLDLFTPSLLVAEIEGQGLERPGYDLCGHVKATWRLRNVPVVLTTFSAYPSDYSQAHSLGAIVCMAKPYKQERLGHVVRLLAPLPEHVEKTAAPHTPDPTRVPGRDFNAYNGNRDRKSSESKSLFGRLFGKLAASR